MRRISVQTITFFILVACFTFLGPRGFPPGALCQGEKEIKEILIKVQPHVIVLPENLEIGKVPLAAARVRSAELRELNKKYNAVSIERLFTVREKAAKGKKTPAVIEQRLLSAEKKDEKSASLENIFTIETKRELQKQGRLEFERREIVEAEDAFLIAFEFDSNQAIDMKAVAQEYAKVSVVTYAEYVVRKEKLGTREP